MAIAKTTNGGESWTSNQVSSRPGVAFTAAVDPADGNVLYTGGYEYSNTADGSFWGGILYKSTDRGFNFYKIGGKTFSKDKMHIDNIAIDPVSSNIIYVSNKDFLYKSWDYGETWTNITPPDIEKLNINFILVDPVENENIFVATGKGIFYSLDGGQSWNGLNERLTVPDTICLEMDKNKNLLYSGSKGGGVFLIKLKLQAKSHSDY
jgi:photosystem II stability/assembly factor-like uncharacterized protein